MPIKKKRRGFCPIGRRELSRVIRFIILHQTRHDLSKLVCVCALDLHRQTVGKSSWGKALICETLSRGAEHHVRSPTTHIRNK